MFIALGINDAYVGPWEKNRLRLVRDDKDLMASFRSLPSKPK